MAINTSAREHFTLNPKGPSGWQTGCAPIRLIGTFTMGDICRLKTISVEWFPVRRKIQLHRTWSNHHPEPNLSNRLPSLQKLPSLYYHLHDANVQWDYYPAGYQIQA